MGEPQLNILFEFRGESERAGFVIPMDLFIKASQPIKESDLELGHIFDMQSMDDNYRIAADRRDVADYVANEISNFLIDNVFNKMDTMNGYLKGQNEDKSEIEK